MSESCCCGCEPAGKKIQYTCDCGTPKCNCATIEFDAEPGAVPHCCGAPMKRV